MLPENTSGWSTLKNKSSASHFYDTADDSFFYFDEKHILKSYEYYSCDSFNVMSVSCSGYIKPLLSGPPVVPVLPMFLIPYNRGAVNIRVVLKSNDSLDIEDVAKHLRFAFNDSVNYTAPVKIVAAGKNLVSKNRLCMGYTTEKYYTILYSFDVKFSKTKKMKIFFEKEFNAALKSNFQPLALKRSSKLSYWMFIIGAF